MAKKALIKRDLFRVDMLGSSIEVGDFVASARHNHMKIGVIFKIHNIMVRIKSVTGNDEYGWLDAPNELIRLNPEDVLAYKLKNQ